MANKYHTQNRLSGSVSWVNQQELAWQEGMRSGTLELEQKHDQQPPNFRKYRTPTSVHGQNYAQQNKAFSNIECLQLPVVWYGGTEMYSAYNC